MAEKAPCSRHEIATAVIALHLGISSSEVTDETILGERAEAICAYVALETNRCIVGNNRMTAKQIFDQLQK